MVEKLSLRYREGEKKEYPLETEDSMPAYPTTVDQLTRYCLTKRSLTEDMRFAPGIYLKEADLFKRSEIHAMYGLEMIDKERNKRIARAGFFIEESQSMLIEHTPQGARPSKFGIGINHKERNRLLRSNFRIIMMREMITIAQHIGLQSIVGVSAQNHFKVHHEVLSIEEAKKRMDDLYETLGFTRFDDNNYHLSVCRS